MKGAEFLHEVEEMLEVDSGSLRPEMKLAELADWNSLAVISVIALVDDRVGLTLNARKVQDCTTVHDLMSLLGDSLTSA